MATNVSKFAASIGKSGLASANKFKVEFTRLPDAVQALMDLTQLSLMCETASLAGRNVQSTLDRQYGVNREVAYNGPTYTPITLSFLMSADYSEKKLFDRWNDKAVSITQGFNVSYYDDYCGTMSVIALGRDGDETKVKHKQTYFECWPKTVAAIELNHSTQNAAVKLTVEMQYAYWETIEIKTTNTSLFHKFTKAT
jgi:hypothetical protein|tara:strand:+ start:34 stop:624 length:591 start_codon:yes stop_codon:yes gene_type:complete